MIQLAQDIFGQIQIVAPVMSCEVLIVLVSSTALTMVSARFLSEPCQRVSVAGSAGPIPRRTSRR